MSANTLPQGMSQITQSLTAATRELLVAANEMRAFCGLDPVALPAHEPACMADLMADLREALGLTVGTSDDLAFAVAAFVGGRYQPKTPAPVNYETPATPEPIPEPVVAPTLAGGILSPSVIDADDLHEQIAETQDEQPAYVPVPEEVASTRLDPQGDEKRERAGRDLPHDLPPVDDERDLESEAAARRQWEEEQEKEAAADLDALIREQEQEVAAEERAASNGHHPEGELAAIGAGEATPRKKGHKPRKGSR